MKRRSLKALIIYWSNQYDLPTHDFIRKWADQKQIYIPVVKDRVMYLKPHKATQQTMNEHGDIWDTRLQRNILNSIDIMILPGVVFDKQKHRLGNGSGYYDKYLLNEHIKKWGICFDIQIVDCFTLKSHDFRMNKIYTPSTTIA